MAAASGGSILSGNPFTLVAQILTFVLFIALCARIRLARSSETKRRRVIELASYIVVVHLAVGVTQKDAWPITNYCLMHGLAPPQGEIWRFSFYGVDQNGREWRVDPYAWRSISDWHLQYWFFIHFNKLAPSQKHEALAWLSTLVERQRAQLAQGNTSISPLGRLSAPEWWMFQRELVVAPKPYRAFRVYQELFHVADAMAAANLPGETGRHRVPRKLLGEWTSP
jgi:hypothetical protein